MLATVSAQSDLIVVLVILAILALVIWIVRH